jgi:hypothetical protein
VKPCLKKTNTHTNKEERMEGRKGRREEAKKELREGGREEGKKLYQSETIN